MILSPQLATNSEMVAKVRNNHQAVYVADEMKLKEIGLREVRGTTILAISNKEESLSKEENKANE